MLPWGVLLGPVAEPSSAAQDSLCGKSIDIPGLARS